MRKGERREGGENRGREGEGFRMGRVREMGGRGRVDGNEETEEGDI